MESSEQMLTGVAVLVVTGLATSAVFRWWQQKRVHRVETWVKEFLLGRYGELPNHLHINCSHDLLWPVLVNFDTPQTKFRHSMQFDCGRPHPAWLLVSEKDEQR
jgi:hypothetical protein